MYSKKNMPLFTTCINQSMKRKINILKSKQPGYFMTKAERHKRVATNTLVRRSHRSSYMTCPDLT